MPIRNNEIYHERDLRAPMTHLNFIFHGAGIQQETEEKTGLARFTAKMLFRGTSSLTREEISRKFELLGAEVSAHVTETDFIIAVSCFSKNLDDALHLLRSIIAEANFPQQELELLKNSELNQLEASFQEPERVLSAAHQYVLYEGKGLGKLASRSGIKNITREDLAKFFSDVRTSSVLYVTAISDLNGSEIEKAVMPMMEKRDCTGFMLRPELEFRETAHREAIIVHSEGAKNDRLMWSQGGLTATDDRRFDLNLVLDALGSFEGYLFDELRNKRGWCYGAYAFLIPATSRSGRIGFYADPSFENSEQLIPEMFRLLGVFSREDNFRSRLKGRNETFKNRYAYQLDLKFKLVSRVQKDRFGIPLLDRESYGNRIDHVTSESAQRVIDEVFNLRRLSMVFYGDAGRNQRGLSRLDGATPITILEKEQLAE